MTKPNLPPSDSTPSELWIALQTLPVPHELVDFPFRDPIMGTSVGRVAMVPLSPEEMMVAHKVADEYARKMIGERASEKTDGKTEDTLAYKQIFADEATVQILWRAMKDPGDKTLDKPCFPAPTVIRRKPFTSDILAVLLRSYLRTCAKVGPIVATMTDEERNAWLDRLEEGGSQFPLDLLSWATLSELLMHSVSRFKQLRTGNGFVGTQPDVPSLGSDNPPLMPNGRDDTPEIPPADSVITDG